MLIRAALVCPMLLLAFMSSFAFAQDLSQEAAAAKERLRQQELVKSKKYLDYLLEKDDWTQAAGSVTALFGMSFDDELLVPLIARTDTDSSAGHRNMIWHAIAYTRTKAADRFLTQRLKTGTPAERALADACMSAVRLREHGVQCDLSEKGVVTNLFFPFRQRQWTAEDLSLVARLPAIETLRIANLADGAMEPLREVTTLHFVGLGCKTPYVVEAIGCLRGSKNLSVLDLGGPVTDAAMPDVGAFSSLTCLRLNDSRVTDAGLRHLESLERLSMLELNDSLITDAGLNHLRGLREMTDLSLAGTAVSGQGLVHLQDMHMLRALNLNRTKIDDRGLGSFQEFAALQNVRFLYLEKTNISDAGLEYLTAMKSAQGIHLSGNERITSDGISRLMDLQALKWVNCVGGRVSDAAAEQFAAGRSPTFYISYTTAPGGPIRHELGRPLTDETPQARLLKKLRRPDGEGEGRVAQSVIDEIAAQGPEIIDPLLVAVKQQHGIYQDVGKVLHQLGPGTLDTLVQILRKDADYRVQSAVTYTFRLHGMQIFPRLREWLADDSENVRHAASHAMYRLMSHSGVEREVPEDLHVDLLKALTDTNAKIRQNAARMLARLPCKIGQTAPELTKAVKSDKDESVRSAAAAALGQAVSGLDGADPILRQAVATLSVAAEEDASFYVRELSIYYLQSLASKDDRALRALVRATGDEVKSVRDKAAAALKKLGHDMDVKQ